MAHKLSWDEVRKQYPSTFVLLNNCEEEHIGARVRILKGEVVCASADGRTIYQEYCKYGQPPHMTFGHTNSRLLELEEVAFLGIRPRHE